MNKNFFENLAIEAGTSDLEMVRKIYYGLVRKTIRDLGNGKKLIYPDFGEFFVKEQKAKRMMDVRSGVMINIDAVSIVKFKPDYKLKDYVKKKNKS